MKAKIGIIGVGKSGCRHLHAYMLKKKNCKIIGITDLDKKKCKLLKKKYPFLKVYKSDLELIKDKDINTVSICSYDDYHFRHIKYCVKYKKNIFCEKPICIKNSDFLKIKTIIKNYKYNFGCNFVLRTVPLFKKIKYLIKKKECGKIFSIEANYNSGRLSKITKGWRGKIKNYSLIHGGLVHMVDLIFWILNSYNVNGKLMTFSNSICAGNTKLKIEGDAVSAIIKLNNNIIIRLNASFGITTPHHHELKIYGSKSYFLNDLFFQGCLNKKINKNSKEILVKKKFKESYPGKNKNNIIYDFVNQINTGFLNKNEISNILKVTETCFKLQKSLKKDKLIVF